VAADSLACGFPKANLAKAQKRDWRTLLARPQMMRSSATHTGLRMEVPFHRPKVGEEEIAEVVSSLRSGWLTTGPKVQRFEQEFARAIGTSHCVAVNSCTAALHLALEVLGLGPGQAVLVPTMTFAATAEVVHHLGAIPILVDCDPFTLNMSLEDAARKADQLKSRKSNQWVPERVDLVGVVPVHVGGLMMDIDAIKRMVREYGLWIVEDAAHAFPAAWRPSPDAPWQRCGDGTAGISCFSFYANKTITTGEGGMAATKDEEAANHMRMMSLHGLSHDAWGRYSRTGSWDYKIMASGFKYNLTDLAAGMGIHQLARAEQMRCSRERIATSYLEMLAGVEAIELPPSDRNRIHSWHLFPIKLRLERLKISRNEFVSELRRLGVGFSVHWRPLHLHPYYQEKFGCHLDDFPVATAVWERLVSLPIFPDMSSLELEYVVDTVRSLSAEHAR
jgi:dTDP-4-amino-4,6-dideoxygalactose transaminase